METSATIFPFGRPALPLATGRQGHQECLVLGSVPDALCVRWKAPDGQLVQNLAVDNEPTAFWDGRDLEARLRTWQQAVVWIPQWGIPSPSRQNGVHGQWLDRVVLAPLHLSRDRILATTLVDVYHVNEAMRHRIDGCYRPLIDTLGLPACSLRPQPTEDQLLASTVGEQRERLLGLLGITSLQTVVTLGAAPCKALAKLIGLEPASTSRLGDGPGYGQVQEISFNGRTLRWYAFVNPAAPKSMQRVHEAWAQQHGVRPQTVNGMFK